MPTITRARITKTLIDKLEPNAMLRDTEIKGFGVRRQEGAPVFFLQKRVNGRLRWMTIGTFGAPWTLDAARKKANELLRAIDGGVDPQDEKVQRRLKVTLAEAVPEFLAEHGPKLKPRTREEYERLLTLHLVPELGPYKLDDIHRAHVARFHAGMASKPAAANFALAVLSKLMTWAQDTGRRKEAPNPCTSIKKYRARKRERYLTQAELARVGEALAVAEVANTESMYAVAAIRLLMLTGARRNEILTLLWKEVDVERSVLRLADSKTGEKVIKLGPAALAVLASIPRVDDNPYVIVGDKAGHHLVAIQNTWERIREAAAIPEVRLHDLRHSFASMAVSSGVSLPMIGKLLGHSNPQTTQRYAHLADDPVTRVNDTVSDAIAAAMVAKREGAA